jgi:hypothetical protein
VAREVLDKYFNEYPLNSGMLGNFEAFLTKQLIESATKKRRSQNKKKTEKPTRKTLVVMSSSPGGNVTHCVSLNRGAATL